MIYGVNLLSNSGIQLYLVVRDRQPLKYLNKGGGRVLKFTLNCSSDFFSPSFCCQTASQSGVSRVFSFVVAPFLISPFPTLK